MIMFDLEGWESIKFDTRELAASRKVLDWTSHRLSCPTESKHRIKHSQTRKGVCFYRLRLGVWWDIQWYSMLLVNWSRFGSCFFHCIIWLYLVPRLLHILKSLQAPRQLWGDESDGAEKITSEELEKWKESLAEEEKREELDARRHEHYWLHWLGR